VRDRLVAGNARISGELLGLLRHEALGEGGRGQGATFWSVMGSGFRASTSL
jgi:hypothetical protein